ncbi:hypothetical protein [Enterococcus faecalis]|uniref:hypothetical protein n=1 Tax=Enterococcus faecalis TaxID=1351 RepID=UPI0022E34E32|nr:hypothetical protein [Enterococcus faecalis]
MNIIYPPLVEQSFQFYQDYEQERYDKSELYRIMVMKNIINENGTPTEEALKKGLVKDFYEEYDLSFEEFLKLYPVCLKEELILLLNDKDCDYDVRIQIQQFLEER